jgi:hypothetical protein
MVRVKYNFCPIFALPTKAETAAYTGSREEKGVSAEDVQRR